jgi:hypothetical protein
MTNTVTPQDFTRINNDVNGNPRYVVHFTQLVNDTDRATASHPPRFGSILELYRIAVKKANKLGGRKYHTKSYGGGIVFQSYCLDNLCERINNNK